MRRAILGTLAMSILGAGSVVAQSWNGPGPEGATAHPPALIQPAAAAPAQPTGKAEAKKAPAHAAAPQVPLCPTCPPILPPSQPEPYPYFSWGSVEQLIWSIKDGKVHVPLVTTGPTTSAVPGAVGAPDTVVLFGTGGKDLDYDQAVGGRATVGVYDAYYNLGLEASVFRLEDQTFFASFTGLDGGNRALSRPFLDAQTGLQQVNIIDLPGVFDGGMAITSQSRFWGLDANIGLSLPCHDNLNVDFLFGFRYLDLREDIDILDAVTVLEPGIAFFNGDLLQAGDVRTKNDRFRTMNQYYAGQLGARIGTTFGRFFLYAKTMVAVGNNHRTLSIDGYSILFRNGVPAAFGDGGLLATRTNIGSYVINKVTVVPELQVALGCNITDNLRIFVTYNFLYWAEVYRPGEMIDATVNQAFVPISPAFGTDTGPRQPLPVLNSTSFWAQGVGFGLGLKF